MAVRRRPAEGREWRRLDSAGKACYEESGPDYEADETQCRKELALALDFAGGAFLAAGLADPANGRGGVLGGACHYLFLQLSRWFRAGLQEFLHLQGAVVRRVVLHGSQFKCSFQRGVYRLRL